MLPGGKFVQVAFLGHAGELVVVALESVADGKGAQEHSAGLGDLGQLVLLFLGVGDVTGGFLVRVAYLEELGQGRVGVAD